MFTFHYVMVFISNSYIVTFCTYYIFPFILFNRSLYHSATLQTVSNAISKSTNAQNNFFFLLFKISKNENNVKILSVVEYDFLNPNWFSSSKKTSSENTRRMVIGRKFLGSKGLPLFLYIGLILPVLGQRYFMDKIS